MRKLLFVASVVFVSACGKGSLADQANKEFAGYRDKMCACKDAACATSVLADWRTWRSQDKFKDLKKSLTDDQKKSMKEIDAAFHECENKFDTSGAPATP